MYIQKVVIENIKSIRSFEMNFLEPAGWHVLIGDNGAGKTAIIRSISLALIGTSEAKGLRENWNTWLNTNSDSGSITLKLEKDKLDKSTVPGPTPKNLQIEGRVELIREDSGVILRKGDFSRINPEEYNWSSRNGWFSVAFGPFRRFSGGNMEWPKVFYSLPKLGAHLSAFGEDVALTEVSEWLKGLQFQKLENSRRKSILDDIKRLINSEGFLPHNLKLNKISSKGIEFIDGNNTILEVNQLSDGYRSILSLTFELIRQLIRVYGEDKVFKISNPSSIDLPGVVLIDEIDAHLHPTWQNRIGLWFTKYFPKIQFIVTTHSPLVCRAADKGSIWHLTAPGSEIVSGQVIGLLRDRLIFGNVLDAYGTELFGSSPVRSEKSKRNLDRLGRLNMLAALGKITDIEEVERINLQQILSTDDPTGI